MLEKKPYTPPMIEPLPFLAINKHPTQHFLADPDFEIPFDPEKLLEKYGSPLYVISEQRLRQDYRDFSSAFSKPYLDTCVAYSIKTNYLPAVCSILREEGAWAEVVSGVEYELSRRLGVPASEIIFNGPHKTQDELQRALGEGAIVNIDNGDELAMVEQIADTLNKPVRLGLRVSFRYGQSPWTKFGFNDENGDCQWALELIARNPNLNLELLHNHGGTFILIPDMYAKAAEKLIDVAKRARDLGLKPTMIDMGGGYPSKNTLKPAYDLFGGSRRNGDYFSPYANAICGQLEQARELFGGRPTLVLEPGRALVDGAVQLVCTVLAKKEVQGQGKAIIVDAGVNLVPTACYYDHRVNTTLDTFNRQDSQLQPVDIYGPLCMQSDRLRERALLPQLSVGDRLFISNVGAYCHTQSMQFIQARPATVLLGPDGPELVRRREIWSDFFALDALPERLRADRCTF
ncbi:MAG: hypothetical protein V7629_13815 [Motiliproteus sp.]